MSNRPSAPNLLDVIQRAELYKARLPTQPFFYSALSPQHLVIPPQNAKLQDLTPWYGGFIMIRANFTMKLNELDAGLIEKLKSLFQNDKYIEISVLDDRDETEYLLSTPANRESILRSLDQLKRHDIVSKSTQDLAI